MQRVLRKRVFRDLKENFFRYLALGLMIVMGIFLVVTIVGSAETLTRGTEDVAEKTHLEDGEFEVFVPLADKDKQAITDLGIEISEQFYYDYLMDDEDESTVRIFKIRHDINEIYYIEGEAPSAVNDIVVEKRYAEEHDLSVGGDFEIAGVTYHITGIGVVSDYDGPYKDITDTSCNSKYFGLVFMTDEAYEAFSASGKAQKSEDYLYAYRLGKDNTDKELKDFLNDVKIDSEEVDDELFQEYWDRTGGIAEELKDAIGELRDATDEVRDALEELADNNDDITDATEDIFEAYLKEAQNSLRSSGFDVELTEDNFDDELDKLIDESDSAFVRYALKDAKGQLDDLKSYKDGVGEYTDAVAELADGTDEMAWRTWTRP